MQSLVFATSHLRQIIAGLLFIAASQLPTYAQERPQRGKVVYEGTYSGKQTEGFILFNQGPELTGAITLTVNFDGSAIRATYKTTGRLASGAATGLIEGDICKLFGTGNLKIEAECTGNSFSGKLFQQPKSDLRREVSFQLRPRVEATSASTSVSPRIEPSTRTVASGSDAERPPRVEAKATVAVAPQRRGESSLGAIRARIGDFSALPEKSIYRTGFEESLNETWALLQQRPLADEEYAHLFDLYRTTAEKHEFELLLIRESLIPPQKDRTGEIVTTFALGLNKWVTGAVGVPMDPVSPAEGADGKIAMGKSCCTREDVTPDSNYAKKLITFERKNCCFHNDTAMNQNSISRFLPFTKFRTFANAKNEVYIVPEGDFVPGLEGMAKYLRPDITIVSIDGHAIIAASNEEAPHAAGRYIISRNFEPNEVTRSFAYIEYVESVLAPTIGRANPVSGSRQPTTKTPARKAMIIQMGAPWPALERYRTSLIQKQANASEKMARQALGEALHNNLYPAMINAMEEGIFEYMSRTKRECEARAIAQRRTAICM